MLSNSVFGWGYSHRVGENLWLLSNDKSELLLKKVKFYSAQSITCGQGWFLNVFCRFSKAPPAFVSLVVDSHVYYLPCNFPLIPWQLRPVLKGSRVAFIIIFQRYYIAWHINKYTAFTPAIMLFFLMFVCNPVKRYYILIWKVTHYFQWELFCLQCFPFCTYADCV